MLSEIVGFIGAGQMARALARGLVEKRLVSAPNVVASDPSREALAGFMTAVSGARSVESNRAVLAESQIVVLAVKPQQMPSVLADIQAHVSKDHLLVSVAAGVPLAKIALAAGTNRIIRVMPNTPCLVGCGASAYSLGAGATERDDRWVEAMLRALGIAFRLDEYLLDAVTGLSGSGPAFVYLMIEALSDGGVRVGLPRDVATRLAAQTVAGAAEMVMVEDEHPAVLKDRVASPGGTTIAGLQALEDHAVRSGLIAAVVAATQRSRELGQS